MKNMIRSFCASAFLSTALCAAPQAVVFDWGNVIATENRSIVVDFVCQSLQCSEVEFEKANLDKREAVKAGKLDVDFWRELAEKKGIRLNAEWPEAYRAAIKASVGADPQMIELIQELKSQNIRVGLLSNINDRYTQLIRDFGFYQPFEPCLLSCEIGLEKPDKKAYEALLEATQLPAHEIVFIDDKMENVEAAKRMGIDAIVFHSAEQIRSDLMQRGALK